jgi:hypothetical protein
VDGVCCVTDQCPDGTICERFFGWCSATRTPTASLTRTPTPTITPEAAAVEMRIGRVAGTAGEIVSVDVSLRLLDSTTQVGGTQNDIELDALLDIATRADGKPDCTANPATRKEAFAAELRCPPGALCGMRLRVFVLSLANVDPIPDGSVLYTCRVAVSADAEPGTVLPLRCSMPGASDPRGGKVTAACRDGEIRVPEAVRGTPGDGKREP